MTLSDFTAMGGKGGSYEHQQTRLSETFIEDSPFNHQR